MNLRIWLGGLAVGLMTLVACNQATPQSNTGAPGPAGGAGQARNVRTVAVSITPVTTGLIRSMLSYSGNIQPKGQVNLVPKSSGRIEKIMVDVGDSVKAGDPVAQMESASARVAVQQAQAALSSAQARLATIRAGARPDDIAVSGAAVRAAQARIDQLMPADSDIAAAQATLAAAQTQYTKAQNDLAKLSGADPDAVRQAELDVERNKASLWSAQANRDGTCGRRGVAEFTCTSTEAQVMAAEVALRQSQAKLETVMAGPKQEDVANAQKSVESARAALESAKVKLDQLVAGPKSADLAAAQASLDQALSQLELKKNPYTDQDVKSAQASVDQAQASLDSAKLNLADTTILAPFDGVIASRNLSEGALASAQSAIASLISSDVEMVVNVEESRIGIINVGLPIALTVSAFPGVEFPGKVTSVAPVGDTKSHTFAVKITPETGAGKLSPGMFADVKITAASKDNAVLISKDAIVLKDNKQVAFIAKDGQASMRPIKIGMTDDKNVEILEGIAAGDSLIMAGQNSLNDGDRLSIPGQGGDRQSQPGQGGTPQKGQGQSGGPSGKPGATPTAASGQ